MSTQLGKTKVLRGSATMRMHEHALRSAQVLADAQAKTFSVWEGRTRTRTRSGREFASPLFKIVQGTTPPSDWILVADPRTGILTGDDSTSRPGDMVFLLTAIVRPDVARAQGRARIRRAARARRHRRGW